MNDPLNDGFDQPHEVSDVLMAFPAMISDLMPKWDSIPKEFRNMNGLTPWNQFVSDWFFTGWPADRGLIPLEGVDPDKAFRHLYVVMRSFEPKHEHKEAAVAWLMSRWFKEIVEVEEP